jgi:ABC-type glycerol-3-phosphate transport system substrate-binding protein
MKTRTLVGMAALGLALGAAACKGKDYDAGTAMTDTATPSGTETTTGTATVPTTRADSAAQGYDTTALPTMSDTTIRR